MATQVERLKDTTLVSATLLVRRNTETPGLRPGFRASESVTDGDIVTDVTSSASHVPSPTTVPPISTASLPSSTPIIPSPTTPLPSPITPLSLSVTTPVIHPKPKRKEPLVKNLSKCVLPDWFTTHRTRFESLNYGKPWEDLVAAWTALEEDMGYVDSRSTDKTHRLVINKLPPQVADWDRRTRSVAEVSKYVRECDVGTFASKCRDSWNCMKGDLESDSKPIRKGGAFGIVVWIIVLWWWRSKASSVTSQKEWKKVVGEVTDAMRAACKRDDAEEGTAEDVMVRSSRGQKRRAAQMASATNAPATKRRCGAQT
ncbi:hypothetical protein M422DRAFT_782490 [Sphaerobolus stellatus SS14]|uniref:Uncharacterized protein n=1 Tax=Sphaerobolus stellatus (strain SS14) TaxID=990650 RepID=A0A0C9TYK1_SPHS4|nr:hypothetical protein M422DRAFT_782490 [Sphaerobolus stellatus SS14]